MYEDIALMIPAFLYAEKVNVIPDVGYYWRSREGEQNLSLKDEMTLPW